MEESIHIDLFYAEKTEQLKRLVCDIGKRMWERGYVDGNGGNISVRLSKECVLCTPTYMSKGRMQPSDLCMVDLGGKQLAGDRRITSEIKTHLAILRKMQMQAVVYMLIRLIPLLMLFAVNCLPWGRWRKRRFF